MPSSMISSTLLALASVATVSAHGFVQGVEIGGLYQTGWLVDYAYNPTPPASFGWTEAALDHGFVSPSQMAGPDIICHLNATNGQLSTKVTAGETMEVFWSAWPDSHKGPVIDYLASCKGNCSTVDKTTLEFFKIDEKGLNNGTWASDELIANNASWAVTIPSTIAPGNYVLRHEIIALHGGGSANGAQLYPFCLNLEVTSSGTDVPAGTLGEALYTETDPGILVNIYVDDLDYVIPGPALYTGGSGSAAPAASSVASVVSTAAAVATSVASSAAVPVVTSVASSSAPSVATSVAASSALPVTTSVAASTAVPVTALASIPTTFATLIRSSSTAQAAAAATSAPAAEEEDDEDC